MDDGSPTSTGPDRRMRIGSGDSSCWSLRPSLRLGRDLRLRLCLHTGSRRNMKYL